MGKENPKPMLVEKSAGKNGVYCILPPNMLLYSLKVCVLFPDDGQESENSIVGEIIERR